MGRRAEPPAVDQRAAPSTSEAPPGAVFTLPTTRLPPTYRSRHTPLPLPRLKPATTLVAGRPPPFRCVFAHDQQTEALKSLQPPPATPSWVRAYTRDHSLTLDPKGGDNNLTFTPATAAEPIHPLTRTLAASGTGRRAKSAPTLFAHCFHHSVRTGPRCTGMHSAASAWGEWERRRAPDRTARGSAVAEAASYAAVIGRLPSISLAYRITIPHLRPRPLLRTTSFRGPPDKIFARAG